MQNRLARLAPLAGVAFFVLIAAAIVIGGETPTTGEDSRKETIDFWVDNDGEQIISSIIGVYAGLFFVWFAATLRTAFDHANAGRASIAARVSWGGALLLAAGLFVALGLAFAVADAADDISRDALYPLAVLTDSFFLPFPPAFALFLIGSGVAILDTRVLARWLGIVAIVLGVISVTPIGFFAFLVGILWIGVASVALFLRSRDGIAAGRPATADAPLGPAG